MKKILSMLLAAAMLVAAAGCSESTKSSATNQEPSSGAEQEQQSSAAEESQENKEPVEITFSIMNSQNEIAGWTAMVDAANAKLKEEGSNVTIKIVKEAAASWQEYYQKIVTQMAAGKAPDLARIANSFMPTVVSKGQAVDITEYVERDLDMSEYFEESLKGANYKEGRYYGLPSGIYYMVMYYNKDLFDEAGLDYPSADWENTITFDETREVAKQLTVGSGANKQFGLSAGPYMAYMGMYSVSNGGVNVFNEDGTCALNSEATKGVYQWFDSMLREDESIPRPTDTKIMGAWDMFKAGRIGMIVEGTWYQQSVKNEITEFNVGIAAVPSGLGRGYSSMFVDDFFICKGTEHEAEAWEALKALYSEEAFSALAQTGVGGLPINRAALENNINELIGEQFTQEDKDAFVNGLDYVLEVPYNDYYEQADQKINNVMDEWLLGKITSDEFADKAAALVDEEAAKAAE